VSAPGSAGARGALKIPEKHVLGPMGGESGAAADAVLFPGPGEGRVELRTVQAVVQRAVRSVVREAVQVQGASRTDSGVHARGQVAAFTVTDDPIAIKAGQGWPVERGAERLMRAINGRLPEDVYVSRCAVVGPMFDPIGDCESKGYSYTLHSGRERPLFDRRGVMQIWDELDVSAMQRAATALVGEHDFAAFAAAGHGRLSTVRRVLRCEVLDCGMAPAVHRGGGMSGDAAARRIRIEVAGTGFLYNMVRIIAGTLVEVGKGKLSGEDVAAALESKDRRRAGPTLPPQGLCLEWIRYRGGTGDWASGIGGEREGRGDGE
jgi:tRNA pseudouridine38-40 synthase